MTSFRTLTERLSPGRLSIRQALIAGMGVMAAGVAMLIVVLLLAEHRLERSRAGLNAQDQITEAAERGNLALLGARRYERDFLLRHHEFSVAEARSRYLPLFTLRMGDLDQALGEIREASEAPETRTAADDIARISQAYRTAFLNVAELSAMRGSLNSGLLGAMRRLGDEVEAVLNPRGGELLLAELLRLRRAETDYILAGSLQYAVVFRDAAQRIAEQIGFARIPTGRKEALQNALGQFAGRFEEYVSLSERIDAQVRDFRAAASGIQPILEQVREHAQRRRDSARQDLEEVTRSTTRLTIALQVLGLLLAGLMAIALYRKIAAMVGRVEDFSTRIGRGDFAARFVTAAGGENARLARALNVMADELDSSRRAIGEHEAELERARRMKSEFLSSVSHELKTPLNAVVGFARLLDSGAAGPLAPQQQEYARQIGASGMHLAELINRILEATRLDSGKALLERAESDLPTLLRNVELREESTTAARATAPSGALVLLVDDHPTNRAVLARQLGALGYECEVAGDGSEALEKWKSGRFGVVITDCDMPVMDGYELARRIREIEAVEPRGRTPIIACTAKNPAGEAERCLAAGMDDCIAKPFELNVFRDKLQRLSPAGRSRVPEPQATAPVDHAVLAEISGGDAAFEREVITRFMGVNAEDAAVLARAVEARDVSQLVHAAHRMKGAGRTVGAADFAEVCADLEKAGRANDWSTVTGKLGAFHLELERLTRYLRSLQVYDAS